MTDWQTRHPPTGRDDDLSPRPVEKWSTRWVVTDGGFVLRLRTRKRVGGKYEVSWQDGKGHWHTGVVARAFETRGEALAAARGE